MSTEPAAAPLARGGLVRLKVVAGALPLGAIFGAIGGLAIAAVGLLRLDRLPFPVCYFKAFSGLPCPTCGSTRAMARLFTSDVGGALAMNPLATLAVLLILIWAVADLALLARGRALGVEVSPGLATVLRVAAVALLLANWAYLVVAGR
jgi:hypothetical protein